MTNAEQVVQALRKHGPLSDSQLVEITGIRPHQQINQLCRKLEAKSVLRRVHSVGGKITIVLTSDEGPIPQPTLRSRIGGNHLNGNAGSSTFRKTLSALLRDPLRLTLLRKDRLDQVSNEAVSAWTRHHLAVATVPFDHRGVLSEV